MCVNIHARTDVPSPSPGVHLTDNFLLRGYSGDNVMCVIHVLGWLNDDIVSFYANGLRVRTDYAEDMLE